MLNEGIFDMQKFVDGGWITGLRYEDEVMDDLKKRTGGKKDKLRSVRSRCHASTDLGGMLWTDLSEKTDSART